MPELPEVETIVRDLSCLVVGRTIESVKVKLGKLVRTGPRRLIAFLVGAQVTAVNRQGKFIVFSLFDRKKLVVHLKMTGQFLWGQPPEPWPKHVHIVISFNDQTALMYRDQRQFGYFLAMSAEQFTGWLTKQDLGPDPFQIASEEFARRLHQRKKRIKALLLDQSFISGLGNIYVDEALFAAGIHPLCPAEAITDQKAIQLHEKLRVILEEAIRLRGSTTNNYVSLSGQGGEFQNRHKVYGRTGECCLTCGQPLVRMVVAGRGTHFCSTCQFLDET